MSHAPHLAARLTGFTTTIFAEMSALALATDSINLGQGFPDTDGADEIKAVAIDAIAHGDNQYPPGNGVRALRQAVANHQARHYGLELDPDTQVLITTGATEAIAAALLALVDPGDEIVMFEPTYDSYGACVSMAGGRPKLVRLHEPDWSFDDDQLRGAIGPRTTMILLNSPHNPTGKVFSRRELELVASLCVEHNLIAVTDEVYEHLVFEGEHVPLATLPGMAERTVSISSAGKTFSFTGWKVGWATGPSELVAMVRAAKQFLTYTSGAPFQLAIAYALDSGDRFIDGVARTLRDRRDQFCDGMEALGTTVYRPSSTYFATTDVASIGEKDGYEFCLSLPERCGVVAIPSSVFYAAPESGATLVRWAFCKQPGVLDEAMTRLASLHRTLP